MSDHDAQLDVTDWLPGRPYPPAVIFLSTLICPALLQLHERPLDSRPEHPTFSRQNARLLPILYDPAGDTFQERLMTHKVQTKSPSLTFSNYRAPGVRPGHHRTLGMKYAPTPPVTSCDSRDGAGTGHQGSDRSCARPPRLLTREQSPPRQRETK